MSQYEIFYQKISQPFRDHPFLLHLLKLSDKLFTGIMYLSYPILLIILYYQKSDYLFLTILIPALSFLILSFLRDKLNASRPYEQHQINVLIPKDTKGHSMPSRHIFSSAIISMCFFQYNETIAIIFLIITACNAMVRVIAGVHYPKDVIIGFIIGILVGLPFIK